MSFGNTFSHVAQPPEVRQHNQLVVLLLYNTATDSIVCPFFSILQLMFKQHNPSDQSNATQTATHNPIESKSTSGITNARLHPFCLATGAVFKSTFKLKSFGLRIYPWAPVTLTFQNIFDFLTQSNPQLLTADMVQRLKSQCQKPVGCPVNKCSPAITQSPCANDTMVDCNLKSCQGKYMWVGFLCFSSSLWYSPLPQTPGGFMKVSDLAT